MLPVVQQQNITNCYTTVKQSQLWHYVVFIQELATVYWHACLAIAKNILPPLRKKQAEVALHTSTIKSASRLSANSNDKLPVCTLAFRP